MGLPIINDGDELVDIQNVLNAVALMTCYNGTVDGSTESGSPTQLAYGRTVIGQGDDDQQYFYLPEPIAQTRVDLIAGEDFGDQVPIVVFPHSEDDTINGASNAVFWETGGPSQGANQGSVLTFLCLEAGAWLTNGVVGG